MWSVTCQLSCWTLQSRLVEKELLDQLQRQLTTAEEALAAKQSKIDSMTQEMLLKERDLETISVFQAQVSLRNLC